MKKTFLAFCLVVLFCSCGLKEQADELQALKNCTYEVVAIDSLSIADTDVNHLFAGGGVNLLAAPQVAMAYLQHQMPIQAVVQLKITNPGAEDAGVNQLEYKVLLANTELLNGLISRPIEVPAGSSVIIPIRVDKDFYSLISLPEHQKAVTEFLNLSRPDTARFTLKIKPTFLVAGQNVAYPDFFDIQQSVSNQTIVSYLRR